MTLPTLQSSEANTVDPRLEALAPLLPSLALQSGHTRLAWLAYVASIAGICVGLLLVAVATRITWGADLLGWLAAFLMFGGIGGIVTLALAGATTVIWRLVRAPSLLMARLDAVYEAEKELISQLSVLAPQDLSQRARYAKLQGQIVERSAVAVSILGIAATQSKPLFDAWRDSRIQLELQSLFATFPGAFAVGACLSGLLLIDHARTLARLARLYEEAALPQKT